jgi:HEAT repeat protein
MVWRDNMMDVNLEGMSVDCRTDTVFFLITKGRDSDRYKAQGALLNPNLPVDRRRLRKDIIEELKKDESRGKEEREDPIRSWNRAWLLHTLGIISYRDDEAIEEIEKYLDPKTEPEVRFWALGGLVRGGASNVQKIAEKIRVELKKVSIEKQKKDMYVQDLALAILASGKNENRAKDNLVDQIINKISEVNKSNWNTQECRSMLRALRFLYIPETIGFLLDIVSKFSPFDDLISFDVTYEAIAALDQVPKDSVHVNDVIQTLTNFIVDHRQYGRCDGMRIKCFETLGNMKAESATPVLVEELTDGNPAIIEGAAKALEEILETRTAVTRVVEAASREQYHITSIDKCCFERFGLALSWMKQDLVVEELEAIMVAGPPSQRETARRLLSEIGGSKAFQKLQARTKSVSEHMRLAEEAEKKIRDLFESSIKEARKGFRISSTMDVIVFAIGVFLVFASAYVALSRGGTLNVWAGAGVTATGGTGVAGILYSIFISDPRKKVEKSVDHMMKLKIIFLAYLRQLNQIDQYYVRQLLEDEPPNSQEISELSNLVQETMNNALKELRSVE